jgi:hypothetical protein
MSIVFIILAYGSACEFQVRYCRIEKIVYGKQLEFTPGKFGRFRTAISSTIKLLALTDCGLDRSMSEDASRNALEG